MYSEQQMIPEKRFFEDKQCVRACVREKKRELVTFCLWRCFPFDVERSIKTIPWHQQKESPNEAAALSLKELRSNMKVSVSGKIDDGEHRG